jgi:hypothetical protein
MFVLQKLDSGTRVDCPDDRNGSEYEPEQSGPNSGESLIDHERSTLRDRGSRGVEKMEREEEPGGKNCHKLVNDRIMGGESLRSI